jgi:beta-lactamase regulating signal transducer with metallopeptidase domain
MTILLFRHLLESTLFCVLFGSLAFCLRRQSAAARHSVWLVGLLKFSIPSVLFTATGAWMALVLPATAWVSLWAAKFSHVLIGLFGIWPSHIGLSTATLTVHVFLIVWTAGSATMVLIWLRGLRKSRRALSLATNEERTALDAARRKLSVRRTVGIRCSERVKEPALVGIFHPLITS